MTPLAIPLIEETSHSDPIDEEVEDGHPRLGTVAGRGENYCCGLRTTLFIQRGWISILLFPGYTITK